MAEVSQSYALAQIRERHEERIASGMVGGVREWFEIATLLKVVDELMEANDELVAELEERDND
jgi:hypothetical protein